jgi:hypothetical protein
MEGSMVRLEDTERGRIAVRLVALDSGLRSPRPTLTPLGAW